MNRSYQFLVLCSMVLSTMFSFCWADLSDSPNIKYCKFDEYDVPPLQTPQGYFADNHSIPVLDGLAQCSTCDKQVPAIASQSKLGGGPNHYKGEITWSASCKSPDPQAGKTIPYDFWVYKINSFSTKYSKILSSDVPIKECVVAVFNPRDFPHEINIKGLLPEGKEKNVFQAAIMVNGSQIGNTLAFDVWNANWFVASELGDPPRNDVFKSKVVERNLFFFETEYEGETVVTYNYDGLPTDILTAESSTSKETKEYSSVLKITSSSDISINAGKILQVIGGNYLPDFLSNITITFSKGCVYTKEDSVIGSISVAGTSEKGERKKIYQLKAVATTSYFDSNNNSKVYATNALNCNSLGNSLEYKHIR
ncbi:MAG: hypothetical protein ACRC37_06080 [Lentisphaeria bacterium]